MARLTLLPRFRQGCSTGRAIHSPRENAQSTYRRVCGDSARPRCVNNLPTLGDCLMARFGLDIALTLLPRRELRRRVGYFLVWNAAQNIGDTVQPRALLVVGRHKMPRCYFRIGRREHGIART